MDDLELKAGEPRELLLEIRALIEEARRQTAVAVNMGLTVLYCRIGKRRSTTAGVTPRKTCAG
jgi:hypothetical protein